MKLKEESNRTHAQYQKKFLPITNIFIVVRAFLLFIPFEKILFEFRDLRRKISKSHLSIDLCKLRSKYTICRYTIDSDKKQKEKKICSNDQNTRYR